CGVVNATGTIIVTPNNTVTSNAARTLCINTALSPAITHTTTGATGIGTATGLPAGVTATWAANTITISGMPTAAGTFNYTIPLTGGCGTVNTTGTITVNPLPTACTVGTITQPTCITPTGSVVLSGLPGTGSWTITRSPGGTTYTGTGVSYTVTGLPAGATHTFMVTNDNGCTSPASANVAVNGIPSNPTVVLDFNGSPCMEDIKVISAIVTGGSPGYSYNWTGPMSFTGTTQSININSDGNYYLTVTDINLCTAVTSGFVYDRYELFIVSLSTEICEGESINLQVDSPFAVSYQWGANAENATTASVTVLPTFPSSSYQVTVTNDLGCVAVPDININVKPKPIVNITGPNEICVGNTTNLTPNIGGTWISSNPSVASITNGGVVTGISGGTANFVFTNSTTQCSSDPSLNIIVNNKPTVSVTGPNSICKDATTTLSPSSGGTWLSNNSTIASVTSSGIVTGLNAGTATFVFTDNATGCSSLNTTTVTVSDKAGVTISGPQQVCVQNTITLSASSGGGSWVSSNTSVATIHPSTGVLTGVAGGSVVISYMHNSGACSETATYGVLVNQKPTVQITGDTAICAGLSTTLSPTTGGIWVSSNSSVAIVNNDGLVTGIAAGTATFTFTNNGTGCQSDATGVVTIYAKPIITLNGANEICVGSTTTFSPLPNGTWSSNNFNVASISETGVVTGVNPGLVRFAFTAEGSGCVSEESVQISVTNKPVLAIDYNGSVCLTDTSQLSVLVTNGTPSFNYNWSGPSGFSRSTALVTIINNGNYSVTVTDSKGCSASISAFVHQRYVPVMVNLNTAVCEGSSVNLAVNASEVVSYQWGSNAGNATTPTVNVTPQFPFSDYTVTVTNTTGCIASVSSQVLVNQKPQISFEGPADICLGHSTSVLPSSGGVWAVTNPSVASITNNGLITGIGQGTTGFIFTLSATGCKSDTSAILTVHSNTPLSVNGPNTICVSGETQLLPVFGGIWTSNNPSIASVTSNGVVTGISQGIAGFTFTSNQGCLNTGGINIIVNEKPFTFVSGDSEICVNAQSQLLPSSGGVWVSNNPVVASVSNEGFITGLSAGDVTFTFTDSNGCVSAPSSEVTVIAKPNIILNGPDSICIGSTTAFLPNSGGIWMSSNPLIATINSQGIVMGINAGQVSFSFIDAATGCSSGNSQLITINSRPVISVSGPTSICLGAETNLLPSSGGVWVSSNPSVATVTNAGVVKGISFGTVTFTFTNTITGCVSNPSSIITVNNGPTVGISGPQTICIGGSTNLFPSTGGSWSSLNPSVATVTNTGIVQGISFGSTGFIFTLTSTGCISAATQSIAVAMKPTVGISGDNIICAGASTTLFPSSGGTWVSNNPSVATVTANGTVTGLTNGVASFRYTSDSGCQSDLTDPVSINGKPLVMFSGPTNICTGLSTNLLPNSGGTWASSNSAIATVENNGLVTGIAAGVVRFAFINSATGCVSDSTQLLTVHPRPVVSSTSSGTLCIGTSTNVFPSTGGIWSSTNQLIASVNNSGLVTGLTPGTTYVSFTQLSTGCISENNIPITVNTRPNVSFIGANTLCIGDNTTLSPNVGGTWTSQNPVVASVTSSGFVLAKNEGFTKFTFTDSSTGCSATTSNNLVVKGRPNISLSGPESICIEGETQFLPSAGGIWESFTPNIAIINNQGTVTGVSQGNALFRFTDSSTGCVSSLSQYIFVFAPKEVSVSGPTEICLGYGTTLFPSDGGVWFSADTTIARVSSNGFVKGIAPGKVSFYFVDTNTGCVTYLPDNSISVINCIDPDFAVTLVNVPVTGNVSTNDDGLQLKVYNQPFLISKPSASMEIITLNNDGTYNFVADKAGKYVYKVPLCIAPNVTGCPGSLLEITVVDHLNSHVDFIVNPDFYTVYQLNTPGREISPSLKPIKNDFCIKSINCNLVSAANIMSVNIHDINSVIDASGNLIYVPATSFKGQDTVFYQLCATECVSSHQIITVNAPSALNSTVGVDDFFMSFSDLPVSGNVMLNDTDPEMDSQSVVQQGSLAAPIVIPSGSYYIASDGNFLFTPASGFSGPVQIVYTVCDDNLNSVCTKATLHLLIVEDYKLRLRVYLEGALMQNGGAKGSDNRPLMRDNLRLNPFTGQNYIPVNDPYSINSYFVQVSSKFVKVGPGTLAKYKTIPDPQTVFNITGQNAIVDWVFVELRSKTDNSKVIATRSGLLQRDGDVVDLDGLSYLSFPGVMEDSFYVVVKHRNHLGVMSGIVSNNELVDFTKPSTTTFDFGSTLNNGFDFTGLAQKSNVVHGYKAMWAGDFDCDGKLKFANPNDDLNMLFFDVLAHPDNLSSSSNFDFGHGYIQGDYDLNGKTKYDNPNDDKNLLFGQILFYPLNSGILSNFNFLIVQVPPSK
ncbi:MAG: Ig-like domain-containing protein, partial [Saprospiraceae bacterium]|nr:Ig-like domain-containing protein [Saprospiraceae bacterium]